MTQEQERKVLMEMYLKIEDAAENNKPVMEQISCLAYQNPRADYIRKYHPRELAISWGLPENTPADEILLNTYFVQLPWETLTFWDRPEGVVRAIE